jgi:hypothetical protein
MKTKNVFELTDSTVTMRIYDVTAFNKGDDTSNAPLLAEHEFDVTKVPATLNDGDNPLKSLAAYGLSRLMQDRSSSCTDGALGENCTSVKEVAEARLAAYKETYDLVCSGEFRARREGSGGGKAASVDTFFAQALVNFLADNGKDMDINTATVYLQSLSADERKALRTKLAPQISAAREAAREAAKGFDIGDLLG